MVNCIEQIYQNTKSAIWNGEELSNYFDTKTGVKQGCLLSPLLFALYLNDLHDSLKGGLTVDGINIRLLMYADDIVILAEEVEVLQQMIKNLEEYCHLWGMEVNLSKSEIMIFRKSGRTSAKEIWNFNGQTVIIKVSEYKYLGIILTPKMSYSKHITQKNDAAKVCINLTWKNFVGNRNVSLKAKWKFFLAVCRSIQSYGAQVWGNTCFEEIDKLQRYFTKRILKLPNNTPNYVIALETSQQAGHIYTYCLHLQYISKTLFDYDTERLPHKLSNIIISRNIFWFKDMKQKMQELNISLLSLERNKITWNDNCINIIETMKTAIHHDHVLKATNSQQRIYKFLKLHKGQSYCNEAYSQEQISYILKARADLLPLNGNQYREETSRLCSLCNLNEVETTRHFIARCPIFNYIRIHGFGKVILTDTELIQVLNGEDIFWVSLYNYVKSAIKYRAILINEFNY
ncbi:RNA-directed DNA polymerase from mobile element jockey [Lucilia cuprina]|nr:RNA-directed DNA polymerase from mobile element jockey [Lucilia cuprina]